MILQAKRFFTTFIAFFLCVPMVQFFIAQPAYAIEDGTWGDETGSTIIIGNETYKKEPNNPLDASDSRNMPDKIAYSAFVKENNKELTKTIFVEKNSTPTEDAAASLGVYERINGKYQTVSTPESLTITTYTGITSGAGTCGGGVPDGLGWILCPIARWLSGVVDEVYTIITSFLEVKPFTQADNGVFSLWRIMLSIANAVFIIIFLAIVYSQITGVGVSNYGIKEMLPRIILGVILANASYWICALLIDASNVLGYSIQAITADIVKSISLDTSRLNWESITTHILSEGALVGGLAWLGVTTVFNPLSMFFFLLSTLASVAFSLLVAFIILAARQALIVVLVLISPLAAIALIMPSTKDLFSKWQKALTTLLVFFPIFSLLFGGSQLAGYAVISRADGRLEQILIGMAILTVPLIITPLIIRFSSGLLGQIANITNNAQKGPLDRFKNWSNDMGEYHKSRELAKPQNRRNALLNPGAAAMRGLDHRRRNRERNKKTFETEAETNSLRNGYAQRQDTRNRIANDEQERIQSQLSINDNNRKATQPIARSQAQALYDLKKQANDTSEAVENMNKQNWAHRAVGDSAMRAQQAQYETTRRDADMAEEHFKHDQEEEWYKNSLRGERLTQALEHEQAEKRAEIAKGRSESTVEQLVASNGDQEKINLVFDNNSDLVNSEQRSSDRVIQLSRDVTESKAIKEAVDLSEGLAKSEQDLNNAKITQEGTVLVPDTRIDIQTYAAGIKGDGGKNVVVARAKQKVVEEYIKNVDAIKNTLSYEQKRDFDYLESAATNTNATQEEVDAYISILMDNGAPGQEVAFKAIDTIEQSSRKEMYRTRNGVDPAAHEAAEQRFENLQEIIVSNGNIKGSNRAIEIWANATKKYEGDHKNSGEMISLRDITNNDTGIWHGVDAEKFAGQSRSVQEHAIKTLLLNEDNNPKNIQFLQRLRDYYKQNPQATAKMKPSVRQYFEYEENGNPVKDFTLTPQESAAIRDSLQGNSW